MEERSIKMTKFVSRMGRKRPLLFALNLELEIEIKDTPWYYAQIGVMNQNVCNAKGLNVARAR